MYWHKITFISHNYPGSLLRDSYWGIELGVEMLYLCKILVCTVTKSISCVDHLVIYW
jgi:hypothetical protein